MTASGTYTFDGKQYLMTKSTNLGSWGMTNWCTAQGYSAYVPDGGSLVSGCAIRVSASCYQVYQCPWGDELTELMRKNDMDVLYFHRYTDPYKIMWPNAGGLCLGSYGFSFNAMCEIP